MEEKRAGTASAPANDRLAHDMRFDVQPIKLSLEQCLSEGKKALKEGEFSIFKTEGNVTHGFAREYNGVVWCLPASGLVFFVISGPDWQIADIKLTQLKRGFSVE